MSGERQIRFFPLPETGYKISPFPYAFTTVITQENYQSYRDCLDWCIERFGGPDFENTWYIHDVTLWFNDPVQAMEFKLRWV
jgi:hypothetical protein